jgi:predicted aspartyl protease
MREKSRYVTITALLQGKPVRSILDTGAGATCIDADAASRFKLGLST